MPTHVGEWALIAGGEGYEKYTTEDGVMHRQYIGVEDKAIADTAAMLRNDGSGKMPDGQVAFHMPNSLSTHLMSTVPDLRHGDAQIQKAWWRKWQDTPQGKIWVVRGV